MQKMNKVLAGYKYVANFLDAPVRVGMVYRMDDRQFIPAMHFNDAYPDIDLAQYTDNGSPGLIRFNATKEATFSFGATGPNGAGKSEVKLTFKRKRSIGGVIQDAVVDGLRYVPILPQLKAMWTDGGFNKYWRDYIFVFDVVHAASGTLIYSEESNNQVVLRHTLGADVTKIADLASGNFEYVSNTKRTLEIIRNVAHKPLFKAFRFRQNWQPEILG